MHSHLQILCDVQSLQCFIIMIVQYCNFELTHIVTKYFEGLTYGTKNITKSSTSYILQLFILRENAF